MAELLARCFCTSAPRRIAGNPLAFTRTGCRPPVQRSTYLDLHPWFACFHPLDESAIQPTRFLLQQTGINIDTRLAEHLETASCHLRIGIGPGSDNPRYAGPDQGISAWRRPALVAAGLHIHINRGVPGRLTGLPQCLDLGMRLTCGTVPPPADHLPILYDHASEYAGWDGCWIYPRAPSSMASVINCWSDRSIVIAGSRGYCCSYSPSPLLSSLAVIIGTILGILQALDLCVELIHVLKRTIHRCKSYEGNLVQAAQLVHN